MDMFKKDDTFPVSEEFGEVVSMATDTQVRPIVGSLAKVAYVRTCESGQTLFMMSFEAMVGDTDPEDGDQGYKGTKIFPATVAQVQKMAKLQKKADKAAGIVKPTAAPKKVEPVKAEPDDGYDPFADASADF